MGTRPEPSELIQPMQTDYSMHRRPCGVDPAGDVSRAPEIVLASVVKLIGKNDRFRHYPWPPASILTSQQRNESEPVLVQQGVYNSLVFPGTSSSTGALATFGHKILVRFQFV